MAGNSAGRVRATRKDWLSAARDVLVAEGVAEVKVLGLGRRLGVSRSSFYWYFRNRDHLLDEILNDWEARNTKTILSRCALPAESIAEAVCNFFSCFIRPDLFDSGLDFAVREWSRRDARVRHLIDAADRVRLDAVTAMFTRHGYGDDEAEIRARILYYMQLGYHALDVREPMAARMARLEGYLLGFTGRAPSPEVVARFRSAALDTGP